MRTSTLRTLLAATGVIVTLGATLTACSNMRVVPMEPAVNANDIACADVIVRLPDDLDGLERRSTNAQSTGAWGDPASILLYCGIEPSGPTTDECININGIDWIRDDSNDPLFRFEAYGREPGLEVIIDASKTSSANAIPELEPVVTQLPQVRQCTNIADEIEQLPDAE